MNQAFRTPHRVATGLRARVTADDFGAECGDEPGTLTYRRAREILFSHEVHGPQCRQWLAAAAYLSAGLDDE
ncbi:hypothetical protein AB0H76_17155 [Nocardia sp. NPDC050712]|uniref:hypothetical protein n=1 Tax=Nocardia sp. NPDC050712 TaxID=3155518 RepID=UPI0033D720E9